MREVNGCRHTAPGLSVGFGVFMPIKGLVFPLKFLFCLGSLRCRPQAHQWRNSETQELCRDEISRILVSVIPVRRFWGRCPGESVAGLSPQVSWSTSALPSSASTAFSSVPRNHGALHNYLLNVMESQNVQVGRTLNPTQCYPCHRQVLGRSSQVCSVPS